MFTWLLNFFTSLFGAVSKFLQNALITILAAGPIPRHIAFIMDGNRRYARGKHMKPIDGHMEGFQSLRQLLDVCLHLGIECVSIYAFSIENFKRPTEEVDGLMQLAKDKLTELTEKGALLDRYGVRLNVVGKRSLLPADVLATVIRAEKRTQRNKNAILNICMPYLSQDEMTTAVEDAVNECLARDEDPSFITELTIDDHLMTTKGDSPPLDILVRTSGVRRLSDYMLWQTSDNVQIHFIKAFWPNFGMRDFVPIVLDYQLKVWTRSIRAH